MKIPNTPFSTRLSGSAKETELRLRSIFQWKKKRPPVLVILLAALVVLLCFGLFSCESERSSEGDVSGQETPNEVFPSPTPERQPEPEQSDVWIYEPSTHPIITVQSAIYGQRQKDYTNYISINDVLQEDDAETRRMQAEWIGSELAQKNGWSNELLQEHFVAVRAVYDAEYDHTKTPLTDGRITQYFYLIRDPETGLWSIVDNSAGTAEEILSPDSMEYRDQMIREFYSASLRKVYMEGEEPDQPQQGDLRIEEIVVLGEARVYELTGQLLIVRQSRYGNSGWQEGEGYLVITKGMDNAYDRVIGIPTVYQGQTIEEIILQEAYSLLDMEVSLSRDGYPWPVGPGAMIHFYRDVYDGPETMEVLEGWEPIYQEGDYWAIRRWSGVEALCYYQADGRYSVNTFDTTRKDLFTHRGIRVGDSRQEVLAAYPELKSGDYWGKYPGEDYLWYCRSEQDFGAALIFFFENDTVSRIVLIDMFN